MNLRGTLRRAAEVFVSLPDEVEEEHHAKVVSLSNSRGTATDALWAELEEDASRGKSALPTKSVEQIVRDAQGPNLDEIHVSADTPPPAANSDGKMDFSAIYH